MIFFTTNNHEQSRTIRKYQSPCSCGLWLIIIFNLFIPVAVWADPLRSFDEIFTGLGEAEKREIFSGEGLIRSIKRNEKLEFIPAPGSGIDLAGIIIKENPSYLAESLLVIPYQGRTLDRLDIYNALGRIGDLKGRLYHSHTRDAEVALFEEATRIESERNTRAVADPPPARILPSTETMYIRLKDVNFGNTYYRGNLSVSPYGVTYNITNFRNISYLVFTVMKAGKFSAVLYMEPLAEGTLIYSMAGADASDFIAGLIDIPSAISKRLAVFIGWISDGLKAAK